jgi:hypothetical protein
VLSVVDADVAAVVDDELAAVAVENSGHFH